jgi:hypothetical protein
LDSIIHTIKSLILLGILTGGNGIAIPYISDGLLERTLEHSPTRSNQQRNGLRKEFPSKPGKLDLIQWLREEVRQLKVSGAIHEFDLLVDN